MASIFGAPFLLHAALGLAQDDLLSQARDIALRYPIIDTHIDVPYRLQERWEDVTRATESGDFDYPRAVAGGLNAPFMSIYIPSEYEGTGNGGALANLLIDLVEALVGRAPDKFAMAYSPADIWRNFEAGLISLAMGMENGTPLEGKLENVQFFFDRGIRYITLAHAKANHLADSSYDINRPWGGLSPFGKTVVREMNRVGMMVDVSHISDAAVFQVLEVSATPVIASHSSARKFTPGWERNMSDEMIEAVAAGGGVVQINFGSTFVNPISHRYQQALNDARDHFMEDGGYSDTSDPEVEAFTEEYKEKSPFKFAKLEDVLNNFDHVVELVGIDHAGVGSDFDGVGDTLPVDLKDVSMYPNLIEGLLQRGYSEADIEQILYKNLLRVWSEVEAYADRQRAMADAP